MVIDSSSIQMSSKRAYQKTTFVSMKASTGIFAGTTNSSAKPGNSSGSADRSGNASVSLSQEGRDRMENLRERLRQLKEDNDKALVGGMASKRTGQLDLDSPDGKIEVLKKLLEALKETLPALHGKKPVIEHEKSSFSESFLRNYKGTVVNLSSNFGGPNNVIQVGSGTKLVREVTATSYFSEAETTTFSTTGLVKTADGREISFNLDLEMSRSFIDYSNAISTTTTEILCDPLVINIDSNTAHVTDQKFFFDLDADGTMDEISFLERGSGFLALDRNNDGKINDGTELFGTESGNGFADLAAYDSDKNGWIDENDAVFNRLKIWTKDRSGNDMLIGLSDADVGAIYLGNVSTEYSLNNLETNQHNAQIRQTGIYLKESGDVKTIQHVDLVL